MEIVILGADMSVYQCRQSWLERGEVCVTDLGGLGQNTLMRNFTSKQYDYGRVMGSFDSLVLILVVRHEEEATDIQVLDFKLVVSELHLRILRETLVMMIDRWHDEGL
jgi:hypothetical protein